VVSNAPEMLVAVAERDYEGWFHGCFAFWANRRNYATIA
jgi:hypothetical protein